MEHSTITNVDTILREDLARGNRAALGMSAVLQHMLANEGQSLVNDAVVARVRGMLSDLATQLVIAQSASTNPSTLRMAADSAALNRLSDTIAGDPALLGHCYALAIEGLLAERIGHQSAIDPVLSPLLQELIASQVPAIAELAMITMAAQARFIQTQRRMELPIGELPADMFHMLIERWAMLEQDAQGQRIEETRARLRDNYDEGTSRLGLLARLISTMRGGAIAALALDHAGIGLFASALASLSRQSRERIILSCHEQQLARFALGLRAAGLDPVAIERQCLVIEPAARMPRAIAEITPQRAQALLADSEPAGLV